MAKKMSARLPSPVDAGLEQIDDLERRLILANEQGWAWSGVSAEEIARVRPGRIAEAKAICDALRADHRARSQP